MESDEDLIHVSDLAAAVQGAAEKITTDQRLSWYFDLIRQHSLYETRTGWESDHSYDWNDLSDRAVPMIWLA